MKVIRLKYRLEALQERARAQEERAFALQIVQSGSDFQLYESDEERDVPEGDMFPSLDDIGK